MPIQLPWLLRSFQNYFSSNYSTTTIGWPGTNFASTGEYVVPMLERFGGLMYQVSEHETVQVRVKLLMPRTSQADRIWTVAEAVKTTLQSKTITVNAYGTSSSTAMGYLRLFKAEPIPLPDVDPEIAHMDVIFPGLYDEV